MPLCETCAGVFASKVFSNTKNDLIVCYFPHESLQSFVDSVDGRCYLCTRIYQQFSEQGRQLFRQAAKDVVWNKETPFLRARVGCVPLPQLTLSFAFDLEFHEKDDVSRLPYAADIAREFQESGPSAMTTMITFVLPSFSHNWPPYVTRPVSATTHSPDIFTTIQRWAGNCSMNHTACDVRRSEPTFHPTRLLDLGPVRGPYSDRCRIVHGNQVAASDEYGTLSHCWSPTGDDKSVRLTMANLADYTASDGGVCIADMSPTFRDAVTFFRAVEIRYLWIDSLCIVQEGDESADWTREALTMCKVYQNSVINACADWGVDGHGLFYERDPGLFQGLPVEISREMPKQGAENQKEAEAGVIRELYYAIDSAGWGAEVTRSPLNRRAGALQARLLSPCNVHFCRREVYWECCEEPLCESFQDTYVPWELLNYDHTAILKLDMYRMSTSQLRVDSQAASDASDASESERGDAVETREGGRDNKKKEDTQETGPLIIWRDFVLLYGKRQLTRYSDRLAAVAGMAGYLRPMINETYVLGLWLGHLGNGMVWYRRSPETGLDKNIDWDYAKTRSTETTEAERWGASFDLAGSREWDDSQPLDARSRSWLPSFSWASILMNVHIYVSENQGLLAEATCVHHRGDDDVAVVQARNTADVAVTKDILLQPSEPTVEMRVTGVLKRMRLQEVEGTFVIVPLQTVTPWKPYEIDEPGMSTVEESFAHLGVDERKLGDKNDKTDSDDIRHDFTTETNPYTAAFLDRVVPHEAIGPISRRTYYYMPWIDPLSSKGVLDVDAGGGSDYESASIDRPFLLLLEPVESADGTVNRMGRFRRIGVCRVQLPEQVRGYLMPQKSPETVPCWSYDESSRKHTIYIV